MPCCSSWSSWLSCYSFGEQVSLSLLTIPKPRPLGKKLLESLNVQLPKVVPDHGIIVSPRKNLVGHASIRHKAIHKEIAPTQNS